ncbi:putative Proteasome assembly chaperone 3 [Seiridium unicorne]|uniref:Proteasome assembly chaperone 3 n=1 Tax=Seiridium unicorne TaxID=138068 RepID=A0ABR2V6K5_9PEZI
MDDSLSFPLPKSLDTRVHMRVIVKSKVLVVYLTTVSAEEAGNAVPMGSMVYALPDRFNPGTPLSTPIYKEEPTFDFATRFAKILVKKTQMHVYVSNSISLASTGLGGTFEEEMEAFKKVIEVALGKLQHLFKPPNSIPNGTNEA